MLQLTGEGKNSWLTGTAAWSFIGLSNYILGIKPDYDGLVIDPCIPKEWKEYKVTRKFRGRTFNITIKNPNNISKGKVELSIDDNKIPGNKIPLYNEGEVINVNCILL